VRGAGGLFTSYTYYLSFVFLLVPTRVRLIHRIVPDIGVEVDLVLRADGVGLQEPAGLWAVDAGLVMIELELRQPGLARVLEPAGVVACGDAILVIAPGRDP
jgi:hypothetical protein